MMQLISVIVPIYNVEKYLLICLKSIAEQTYSNIEVILIDDGSTDESGAICDEFVKHDPRFKVYHQSNQGVSQARNIGIDMADGEYIVFIDGDDWIEPKMCELLLDEAIKSGSEFVICGNFNEATSGTTVRKLFSKNSVFSDEQYINEILVPTLGLVGEKLKRPDKLDKLTPIWARLYRREIVQTNKVRFIDLKMLPSECLQFNFEYCTHCKTASYIDMPLYHYRRNTVSSVTKPYRNDLLSKWYWWFDYMKPQIEGDNYSEHIVQAFYSRVCCSVIPLGGNALKLGKITEIRKEIKAILRSDMIIEAFNHFDYHECPFYWKVFFSFAKHKVDGGFLFITYVMRKLLEKRKK